MADERGGQQEERHEAMLDEVARRRGQSPQRAQAVRESAYREQLVHARTDGATLYCGLPADAPVHLDYDEYVTCSACLEELRRQTADQPQFGPAPGAWADYHQPSDDEVVEGLLRQREDEQVRRISAGVES